jgi:hypothetical protein
MGRMLDAGSAMLEAAAAENGPERRCAACDYDLRGLAQNRCPECGLEFDPHFLPTADVPWLRRDDRALLAYLRTVALVLLRPRKFGQTVWQDVDVRASDAVRFRWVTIGIATGSALALMLIAVMPPPVIAIPLLAPPVLIFFWMATARFNLIQFAPARFADEMRYRHLHELTCAGLALSPLAPLFALVCMALGLPDHVAEPVFVALCWLVPIAWWYGSLRFQIYGGRCTRGDALLHAVLLPFAWLLIAGVVLVFGLGTVGLAMFVIS